MNLSSHHGIGSRMACASMLTICSWMTSVTIWKLRALPRFSATPRSGCGSAIRDNQRSNAPPLNTLGALLRALGTRARTSSPSSSTVGNAGWTALEKPAPRTTARCIPARYAGPRPGTVTSTPPWGVPTLKTW